MVTHEYPNHCGKSYCLIDTLDSIPYFDINKDFRLDEESFTMKSSSHTSIICEVLDSKKDISERMHRLLEGWRRIKMEDEETIKALEQKFEIF
ncbi:hypothetical protein CRE_08396 [Caenorhabditis remanei]|uniref:Uncharacterized protein n=1 Tax=Caenorhabditis remanei TaxID=31234 RepID=E3MPI2_CAERE|nr:hypothetical protein CRE_08396 [Caenorhabditis remanei]